MPNNDQANTDSTEAKPPDGGGFAAPPCSLRNGAYSNQYGDIYLRVVSLDTQTEGWPLKAVDHGLSIEEAHCVMAELMAAIHESSLRKSGRANDKMEQPT